MVDVKQYIEEHKGEYYAQILKENEALHNSRIGKYRRAYKYYVDSCERANETPVSFDVYLNRMPQSEVERMIELYNI